MASLIDPRCGVDTALQTEEEASRCGKLSVMTGGGFVLLLVVGAIAFEAIQKKISKHAAIMWCCVAVGVFSLLYVSSGFFARQAHRGYAAETSRLIQSGVSPDTAASIVTRKQQLREAGDGGGSNALAFGAMAVALSNN